MDEFVTKDDAIKMTNEIICATAKSSNSDVEVVDKLRDRVERLEQQWTQLGTELDDGISSCRKARLKRAGEWIKMRINLFDQVNLAMRASTEAGDAEELSEHLDVIINLK